LQVGGNANRVFLDTTGSFPLTSAAECSREVFLEKYRRAGFVLRRAFGALGNSRRSDQVPAFILPPPRDLWTAFFNKLPILGNHALITFIEAFGGFALSLVLGVGFAIAVVYSRHMQNTIYPLIVILYAMPKSAFAPLMVIWVGYGLMSKIAIAFLVAFFPIVVNTVVGLKEVEPELLDWRASTAPRRWTCLRKFACLIRCRTCLPASKSPSCYR
jgi:ABC-type nitrate/sulfonate/bicarbonate transport system permease component